MNKINVVKLFYIFIIGSLVGWVVEGLYTLIVFHELVNHSAVVIGPFDMAYGICFVLLTLLFYKLPNISFVKAFLLSFLGGTILEYIMSLGMEIFLGFTAWDYSTYPLNINGRVCLIYSVFWGILGIAWVKLVYPFIMKLLNKFNYKIANKIAIILFIFLVFDVMLTIQARERAKAKLKGIEPKNKYEEFLDNTFNMDYLKNMYNNMEWAKK
ncbi:MAG: putative ABC transporter permease [Bacilli bacterium]|nr:putative ABC transporter permease [Bacilli bacterium]